MMRVRETSAPQPPLTAEEGTSRPRSFGASVISVVKPFRNTSRLGFDGEVMPLQPLGAELAALCSKARAREARLWLLVKSVEESGLHPHGLTAACCVIWQTGQLAIRRFDDVSMTEAARTIAALPDPRRQSSSSLLTRVICNDTHGPRALNWLVDTATIYGALELRFEPDKYIRRRSESLQRLTRAVASVWRHLPIAGGTAIVTLDGVLEHATEHALASVDLLGLPLARLTRGILSGPSAFDLGFAIARVEPLSGPQGARFLIRFEPATRMNTPAPLPLSERQLEVARLAAKGLRVVDIATTLGCAETTIKTHLRAAYATLGVASRVELLRALTKGLPGADG